METPKKNLRSSGQYMLGLNGNVPTLVQVNADGTLKIGGKLDTIPQPATLTSTNFNIANGASLSDAIDLGGKTLVGIQMSTTWTTANLTFQVSFDGITYTNLFDRFGNEVSYTVAANRFIYILPSEWIAIRFIKVRSGTSTVPVTQASLRSINMVSRVV